MTLEKKEYSFEETSVFVEHLNKYSLDGQLKLVEKIIKLLTEIKEEPKKGLLYLSQKTSVPLVPVGISYSKKWILKKTWDKFEIPKPFSKVKIFLGEPILINEEEDLDKYVEIVKNGINKLNNQIEF